MSGGGADTGMTCVICETRIFGAMTGAGDGSGKRFVHPACLRVRELEAEIATLRDKLNTRDALQSVHRSDHEY